MAHVGSCFACPTRQATTLLLASVAAHCPVPRESAIFLPEQEMPAHCWKERPLGHCRQQGTQGCGMAGRPRRFAVYCARRLATLSDRHTQEFCCPCNGVLWRDNPDLPWRHPLGSGNGIGTRKGQHWFRGQAGWQHHAVIGWMDGAPDSRDDRAHLVGGRHCCNALGRSAGYSGGVCPAMVPKATYPAQLRGNRYAAVWSGRLEAGSWDIALLARPALYPRARLLQP